MKATYTTKVKELIGGLRADPPTGMAKEQRDIVMQRCKEKHNGYVTITFSTPHRPRSRGQQGLVHDWFQDIAEYTGNTLDHVKMGLKIMAMDEGWPMQRDNDGNAIIDPFTGKTKPISEADASIEQETILMNVTRRFAAEYKIPLRKLPGENE